MAVNTFDEARMQALKDYADLEYELCLFLKAILTVEAPIASAIFYGISATRARYDILGSILEIRHPDTFKKAWPKIESWLIPRDTARNHIVHWGQDIRTVVRARPGPSGSVLDKDGFFEVSTELELTNNKRKWRASDNPAKSYSEQGIRDEAFAVRLMKHVINRYALSVREPEKWPWTDIFQQPITDQTPAEFLSRLNDRGFPALA